MEVVMARKKQRFLAGTRGELDIVGAKGSKLIAGNGQRYIDFNMGWCVGNFDWSHASVKDAIRDFDGPPYIYPGYHYRPWEELAEVLVSMAPGRLAKAYRATGGTEAVDIALQLAMAYTKRGKFISIEGAYHGNSLATGSIGDYSRETYPYLLPNCKKISPPLDREKLKKLEIALKPKDVAAFIMEPIICNLGVMVPEPEFMQGMQKLCNQYGTLFIADEVASGFGRTGRLFACEHFKLEPDILCLAKAITGGYAPMGAVLATARIADRVDEEYYSTYGWHPLCVAAALANLRWLEEHEDSLFEHAEDIAGMIEEGVKEIEFPKPVTVHGKGLAIGIDVGDADYASALEERCCKAGLLFTTSDRRLVLFPALTIERKTVTEALDILKQCAQEMAAPKRKSSSKR
jgi:adenosylmethionine-8-amino-7-oxononanoate aminotransferase